jgi:NADH dehydrogenase [ubiquinone] 1 alpha subcomplex assembly factor 7
MKTSVAKRIHALIGKKGSIGIDDYMRLALAGDEQGGGYYATRDPLGAAGDFVTAPEVSQIFGEIIGAWCAHMWDVMGRPNPFLLVEPGPGRGTLMADMLRAARLMPGFLDAARIHLIETSPALRARQREKLAGLSAEITWHDDFGALPEVPMLLVANEFFDALPVRQYQRAGGAWHGRRIGIGDDGALAYVLAEEAAPADTIPPALPDAKDGAIFEASPEREAAAAEIGARLVRNGGAALIVDYGFSGPAIGDTFQAVKTHKFADPLAEPGEADLTSHVDFTALCQAATKTGAKAFGPLTQAAFLSELGIAMRAAQLRQARPDKAGEIDLALARLISPDQMGSLFKVTCLTSPGLAPPPPFPDASQ